MGLKTDRIDWATAEDFIRRHHRHHDPPQGWLWGHGLWRGLDLVGVATVGRPVARALDDGSTVEITRVAVVEGVRNGCSALYGAACREAGRRGYLRAFTYTLDAEPGTGCRAAGFTLDGRTKGGQWSTPARARDPVSQSGRKRRWRRDLRPGARLGGGCRQRRLF